MLGCIKFYEKWESRGNDGSTKEFHTAFLGELGSLLLKTFNFSFVTGKLSSPEKQAVIALTLLFSLVCKSGATKLGIRVVMDKI